MDNLAHRTASIVTNLRAELDDRLMHLWPDLLLQNHFAASQNLLDMRAQLARLRIDDLEFFLDAKREDVIFTRHGSQFPQSLLQASNRCRATISQSCRVCR